MSSCFALLVAAGLFAFTQCVAGEVCAAIAADVDAGAMLQLRKTTGAAPEPAVAPALGCPPHLPHSVGGKSVYLIMTDRFSREGGFSDGNMTECGGSIWCNGTLKGIQEHLDYIHGMGFDCIWMTPPVKQDQDDEGPSGWSYHGYWAQDFYDVDPHFGTREDLKELVRAVQEIGMCFILDMVVNHVRPIHNERNMSIVHPFNKIDYLHQLGRGDTPFDDWAPQMSAPFPVIQALGAGTFCLPNNTHYCNNYDSDTVLDSSTYLNASAAGPPEISYCGLGSFCPGFNLTRQVEGWFYTLADLNQSVPFVRRGLLDWAEWMVSEYRVDAVRLDTAAYVPKDFLQELQTRLGRLPRPMQILGEVTALNISYHASFTQADGRPYLAGLENFPLTYQAQAGYLSNPTSVSAPVASKDLTYLAEYTREQLTGGLYADVDLLMNMIDNQDIDPIAKQVEDESLQRNALAWLMFAKGMPVVTWGDEQGNKVYRQSLWQYEWRTDTWQYQFFKLANEVRKSGRLGRAPAKVQYSSPRMFVFSRGSGASTVWVFTNNYESFAKSSVHYPVRLPRGVNWKDALGGAFKVTEKGVETHRGSFPAVLIPDTLEE